MLLALKLMSTQLALAQGTGTMLLLSMVLLTGMPDTGLYPNYEGESFKQPYGFRNWFCYEKLGYKTVFSGTAALVHGKMLRTLFYLKALMNSMMRLKCQAKKAMHGV